MPNSKDVTAGLARNLRHAFNKPSGSKDTKMRDEKTPGARGAHYDPKTNSGTRKPGDKRGRVGSDDFPQKIDDETRHGDLLIGGRMYTSNPEMVDEANAAHANVIDKHAAVAQQVKFTRADPMPNEHGFESSWPGDKVGGERNDVYGTSSSRQAKRGDKKA
jgi:hypothetical protein